MGIKSKTQIGLFILLLFCFVAACSGAAPTEEPLPPANTPVPVSPTAEPEEQPASGWTSYQGAKTVTDMAFDNDGNLWAVGVLGIYQLDPNDQNQEAKSVDHDFISKNLSSIAVAKDGFLWVGTKGEGVAKFDGETWTSYTVEDGLADMKEILGLHILKQMGLPKNMLWILQLHLMTTYGLEHIQVVFHSLMVIIGSHILLTMGWFRIGLFQLLRHQMEHFGLAHWIKVFLALMVEVGSLILKVMV